MDRPADAELHMLGRELVDDILRVTQRARRSVELRHHERVAVSAHGESFAETGSGAIRSRQSVISDDVGGVDAESLKGDPWCGEVQ